MSTFERRFRHSAGDDGTVREALQAAFVTLDDQLADQALSHTADELDLMVRDALRITMIGVTVVVRIGLDGMCGAHS